VRSYSGPKASRAAPKHHLHGVVRPVCVLIGHSWRLHRCRSRGANQSFAAGSRQRSRDPTDEASSVRRLVVKGI
jgi:hypothetical protein